MVLARRAGFEIDCLSTSNQRCRLSSSLGCLLVSPMVDGPSPGKQYVGLTRWAAAFLLRRIENCSPSASHDDRLKAC